MEIINWNIAKNPLNWLIVGVVLLLWGFLADVVCSYVSNNQSSTPANG